LTSKRNFATITRRLRLHAGEHVSWGVLLPDHGPAFVGIARPGIDWMCSSCDQVLLRSVYDRQFLDLLVNCPACNAVNGTQLREPGQPVAGRSVLIPPGRFRLGSAVEMGDKRALMVGQSAINGYVRETGARYGGRSASPPPAAATELSPDWLRSMAKQGIELLGDRYQNLDRSDRHGLRSATPPKRRHRLIEMISYAEQAASALEAGSGVDVTLNGDILAELYATVDVLDRWRNHPAWARLVGSLESADEVRHTVMTLTVASYLVDAGNGLGIIDEDKSGGRIPDLWVAPTFLERLEVEVKTPQALWAPGGLPSASDAQALVERQLNRAGSTARGQINPEFSGIVGIGGFHLGLGGLEVMEAAAIRVLDRQRERKQHIAAIGLFELTYETGVQVPHDRTPQATFTPAMRAKIVRHPGYRGDLQIAEARS
jgi:hypothetical protein